MATPGRNDPCPCGSGRKFKRCCGAEAAPPAPIDVAASTHEMDRRLVERILRLGKRDFPEDFDLALGSAPDPEAGEDDSAQLMRPYLAYVAPFGEETLLDRFLAREGPRLDPRERDWLEANRAAAYLSVWEVLEIDPDRSMRLRDLLTHEERVVVERLGTRGMRPRAALLGRVVDFQGTSLLVGSHPRALQPLDADVVVQGVRRACRVRTRALDPRRLEGPVAAQLLRLWDETVSATYSRPLPRMVNADEDVLAFTEDRFAFDPELRGQVEARVGGIEGVERQEDSDESEATHFSVTEERPPSHGLWERTSLGRVEVGSWSLVIHTNSERRADALKLRVEQACEGLIRHERRDCRDAQDLAASSMGRNLKPAARPASLPGGDEARIVRELKERHYAQWPDTPVPMLGDITPREATKRPATRRKLELLLKDLQLHEAGEEPDRRYDVGALRRELGLDR